MIKVSVITINYNNAAGLEATIRSVVGQTYDNIEYIVIDGGSRDGSRGIISANKTKLSYSISEKDEGIYDAMNKGIVKATGDYLLFLNSGDTLYRTDTIEKIIPFLDNEIEIVYGNMIIDDNGKLSEGFMPDQLTLSHMLRDTLWHPVSFIRRDLFDRFGKYNTSFKICADYDFFFRTVIVEKVRTKHISQFISVFRLDGMSSDIKNAEVIRKEKEIIQTAYYSSAEIAEATKEKLSFTQKIRKWFR